MPTGLLSVTLGILMQVGSPGPSENPYSPPPASAYGQYGSEGSSEPRFPFDSQRNWVHGYFQELPAYGGYPVFRPYNYKHVLSQSQTAAGWGERPMMPYSQQFWHKYHDQATMIKTTQYVPARPGMEWVAAQPMSQPNYYYQAQTPPTTPANYAPYQAPQGAPVMLDRPRMQMPAPDAVNPAGYQPTYGRGY